jgi:hypothetical protein
VNTAGKMVGKVDLILNKLKTMDSLEEQLREQRDIIAGLWLKINMLQETNESLLNMQTHVNTLKTEISVANSDINTLKSVVEVLHRYKAERQILIDVPHVSKENLPAILHKIMLSLKCEDIPTSYPIDARRLGKCDPARKRPPAILAEFNSTFVRNNVMTQWHNTKILFADEIYPEHKNFGENPKERQQIYINKNHPLMLKAILREARQLKNLATKLLTNML